MRIAAYRPAASTMPNQLNAPAGSDDSFVTLTSVARTTEKPADAISPVEAGRRP